ncbi:hypothetical protein P879_00233 [Paragonimus westermani]|uniref:Uncharacterized protein n=1 Tax=Paragonimus westermani TaxID=34504 RepID=A0A8T0DWQ1_9TREM|nr:hypothetical protein P879_00233 [Paragonimus westermani]
MWRGAGSTCCGYDDFWLSASGTFILCVGDKHADENHFGPQSMWLSIAFCEPHWSPSHVNCSQDWNSKKLATTSIPSESKARQSRHLLALIQMHL